MTAVRRRTALAAAAGAPIALAGWAVSAAGAARGASVVETLERLLAVERRLDSTYDAALRRGALAGDLAERLRDHERDHARALEQVLADRRRRAPVAGVPPAGLGAALERGGPEFARFAIALELQAVDAYVDALAALEEPGLRQPLGSIMACEGQHLVALRRAAGDELLPRAFERGAAI